MDIHLFGLHFNIYLIWRKKNPQFWHISPADHQVAELIREQWAIDLCGWEADWLSGRQDM